MATIGTPIPRVATWRLVSLLFGIIIATGILQASGSVLALPVGTAFLPAGFALMAVLARLGDTEPAARPLGLLASPRPSTARTAGLQWLAALQTVGRRVVVPEIADYEVRRELLRLNATRSLRSLDALVQRLAYLPLTTAAMRLAAEFWAQARRGGYPAAPDPALDGDVILAAQAATLGTPVVIATTNVKDSTTKTVVGESTRLISPLLFCPSVLTWALPCQLDYRVRTETKGIGPSPDGLRAGARGTEPPMATRPQPAIVIAEIRTTY